jgi:hypothetical protein
MCHSRRNTISAVYVGYSIHYVFPTVSFVCQTSTMVAAVPAISYHVYMWHVIVSHHVLCQCAHMCVEYRLSFLFLLGIQF